MQYIVIIMFLVVAAVMGYGFIGNSRNKRKREELLRSKMSESEVQKWRVFISSIPELERKRTNAKITTIIAVIAIVLLPILMVTIGKGKTSQFEMILFIPLIIVLVAYFISKREYKKLYKKLVMQRAITEYDSNLTYNAQAGITPREYIDAHFETFDRFNSEDLIEGSIDNINFKMSDVHTQRRHRDRDGKDTYVTLFKGVFVCATLSKNVNASINIINNTIKIGNRDSYITIDNEEFEQKYDVSTTDRILAMRILTPDVTTNLLDLQNEYNIPAEIKIIDNIVYFRFYIADMFEPTMFNKAEEANSIAEYIMILDNIKRTIYKMAKTIEGTDI